MADANQSYYDAFSRRLGSVSLNLKFHTINPSLNDFIAEYPWHGVQNYPLRKKFAKSFKPKLSISLNHKVTIPQAEVQLLSLFPAGDAIWDPKE